MRRMHRGWGVALACVALACGGAEESELLDDDLGVDVESSESWSDDEAQDAPATLSVRNVSLSPTSAVAGERIRAQVRVANSSGESYATTYEWRVAGRILDDETDSSIVVPALRRGESVEVEVEISTESGLSDVGTGQALAQNARPKIYALQLRHEGAGGEDLVADASARDADGDEVDLAYTWYLNDEATEVEGDTFSTALLTRGDRVRVSVVASDGEAKSSPAESGTVQVANASPEILSRPPGLGDGGMFFYRVKAEDPDGDGELEYELVSGPRGMRMNAATGELTWTPDAHQAGENPVEIAVHDGEGGSATQAFNIPLVSRENYGAGYPAKPR